MSIVTQLKVGAVLGGSESAVSFDRAVRVASSVPVYTLNVVRDFDRMPEVVGQIMEWHGHPVVSLQGAVAPAP
jgi:3'-phosphoadenosine 5'-phosphosulfate sulfotransferase (PAPS reductase)/FAD synthetase